MGAQDGSSGVGNWPSRIHWPPRTLKAQFLAYGTVIVLLAVAITTFLNARFAETGARSQAQSQVLQTATAVARALEHAAPAQAQELLDGFHRAFGAQAGCQVVVMDPNGLVIAATDPRYIGKPIAKAVDHREHELQQVLAGEIPVTFAEIPLKGLSVLDVGLPLHGDPSDPSRITGGLHLAVPYRTLTSLVWQRLAIFSLSVLLLIILLIAPLWLYLERSLLAPLYVLTAANEAVAAGQAEGRLIPIRAMPSHELGEAMRSRNAMLDRLEAADTELHRRLRELSALNNIAAILSKSLPLEELLGRTVDKVLEITGMDAGEISLCEPGEKRLVVHAHRGLSANWLADELYRPTTCLCGHAFYQEEAIYLPDISQDERVTRLTCAREGFRSFCAVPLCAEGQVLGVMSLHGRQVRQPSPQEQDLLAAIGSQVAVAVMNVRLYVETQRLAATDPLTGLANRRAFQERLEEEMRRARRYDRPLSLIMADLDYFKLYNDTHGHPAGDLVLQDLAALLRANVRETDLVARYGGEEFVILLPETSRVGARAVAEKVRDAVENHPFPHRQTQPGGQLTISLGVATFPEDIDKPEALIHCADKALYRAKEMGRNRQEVAG